MDHEYVEPTHHQFPPGIGFGSQRRGSGASGMVQESEPQLVDVPEEDKYAHIVFPISTRGVESGGSRKQSPPREWHHPVGNQQPQPLDNTPLLIAGVKEAMRQGCGALRIALRELSPLQLHHVKVKEQPSLMHQCCQDADTGCMLLMKHEFGFPLNVCHGDLGFPFHRACATGNIEVVRLLLTYHHDEVGYDKPTKYSQMYPVHIAAARGHTDVLQALLGGTTITSHGGEAVSTVDTKDGKGRTALHHAADHHHFGVVHFLVEKYGADITQVSGDMRVAWMGAVESLNYSLLKLLCPPEVPLSTAVIDEQQELQNQEQQTGPEVNYSNHYTRRRSNSSRPRSPQYQQTTTTTTATSTAADSSSDGRTPTPGGRQEELREAARSNSAVLYSTPLQYAVLCRKLSDDETLTMVKYLVRKCRQDPNVLTGTKQTLLTQSSKRGKEKTRTWLRTVVSAECAGVLQPPRREL